MNTSDLKNDIKSEITHGLERIQTLRDDIRVRVHLAEMDLKDQWDKIEPKVSNVEHLAHEASDATREVVRDLVQKLEGIRSKLS